MVTGSTTREQSTDRTIRVISERTERVSGRRGVAEAFPRRPVEDGHAWIFPGTIPSVLANLDFKTYVQAKLRGAGGARTHDRWIMRSLASCTERASCTDTTEPCR
jgi:hypothetical protein